MLGFIFLRANKSGRVTITEKEVLRGTVAGRTRENALQGVASFAFVVRRGLAPSALKAEAG